jgi:GxxExxY protein
MARVVLEPGRMDRPCSDGIDSLTEKVIGCGIEVHRALGPGLLESIYRDCMAIELEGQDFRVERDRHVSVVYKGQRVGADLKLDLVVDGRLILELKAVEQIHPIHLAQVITYLKLTGCPAGLIINFNTTSLRTGLRRLVHPDLYGKKRQQMP